MREKVKLALVCNQAWTIYRSRIEILNELTKKEEYEVSVVSESYYDADNHHSLIGKQYRSRLVGTLIAIFNFYLYIRSLKEKNVIFILYSTKANLCYGLLLRMLGCKYLCVVAGLGKLYCQTSLLRFLLIHIYSIVARSARGVLVLNSHDYNIFLQFVKIERLYRLKSEGFSVAVRASLEVSLSKKIIMVSRLIREKGVFQYLNAVKILRNLGVGEDYNFYLIGKYDSTHAIDSDKIRELSSQVNITLVEGAEDITQYINNVDCFVFPSLYNEGMPRVLFEAAEHGSYVITTAQPGCEDFINYGFIGKTVGINVSSLEGILASEILAYITLPEEEKYLVKKRNSELTPLIGDVSRVVEVYEEILIKCT